MSTKDFKSAWEQAVHRAMLARQPDSELADTQLSSAAGLPLRSGFHAGYNSAYCTQETYYTTWYRQPGPFTMGMCQPPTYTCYY